MERKKAKRISRPGRALPGSVDYDAALIRRVEMIASLLAASFPVAYLIDDLVSGRVPPFARYLVALAAMLVLTFVASRFAPSRTVTFLFVAVIYAGYALTLNLPNARAVYIVLFLVAVPLFYFLGGIRIGRFASLGFMALNAVLIATGGMTAIRVFRGIARPYHYAMLLSGLVLMVVVAEANERRHAKSLDIIFREQFIDAVTGLPNASSLSIERLADGEILALVRLRNFKDLRSFFDDAEGRTMAGRAARILIGLARSAGARGPYRISESEFALVHPRGYEAYAVSSAILGAFATETVAEGSPLRFEVQVGSYRTGIFGEGAREAVEEAETALADCDAADSSASHRESGSPDDDFKARAPVLVKNIMERSLAAVFQPVYDVRRDGVGFLEALSRLRVGERLVSPEAYMSATSRLGLEKHFGDFIVEEALEMALCSGHSVSFNVTFRDLERPYFLDTLFKAYASLSDRPNTLIVELTEQAAFSDYGRLRAFAAELHDAGGLIVLDDFGSGYSNYASLLEVRFDAVKVAGDIVREIVLRREAAELYSGLCAFCRAAGLDVVAEYISEETIMARALEGGASLLQGYYFSRPIPAKDILSGELSFPGGRSALPAPMGRYALNSRGS